MWMRAFAASGAAAPTRTEQGDQPLAQKWGTISGPQQPWFHVCLQGFGSYFGMFLSCNKKHYVHEFEKRGEN